jgi:hypothetical protein
VILRNLLAPFVLCAGLAFAQQATPLGGEPSSAANAMTGCLTKGNAAGEYILTTSTGQQTPLISTEDLSKHIDHKVKVNGSPAKQQEKAVFRVDSVEHVADSCK